LNTIWMLPEPVSRFKTELAVVAQVTVHPLAQSVITPERCGAANSGSCEVTTRM
jgi:hypothetical protein